MRWQFFWLKVPQVLTSTSCSARVTSAWCAAFTLFVHASKHRVLIGTTTQSASLPHARLACTV
jgi:hypothetical protein